MKFRSLLPKKMLTLRNKSTSLVDVVSHKEKKDLPTEQEQNQQQKPYDINEIQKIYNSFTIDPPKRSFPSYNNVLPKSKKFIEGIVKTYVPNREEHRYEIINDDEEGEDVYGTNVTHNKFKRDNIWVDEEEEENDDGTQSKSKKKPGRKRIKTDDGNNIQRTDHAKRGMSRKLPNPKKVTFIDQQQQQQQQPRQPPVHTTTTTTTTATATTGMNIRHSSQPMKTKKTIDIEQDAQSTVIHAITETNPRQTQKSYPHFDLLNRYKCPFNYFDNIIDHEPSRFQHTFGTNSNNSRVRPTLYTWKAQDTIDLLKNGVMGKSSPYIQHIKRRERRERLEKMWKPIKVDESITDCTKVLTNAFQQLESMMNTDDMILNEVVNVELEYDMLVWRGMETWETLQISQKDFQKLIPKKKDNATHPDVVSVEYCAYVLGFYKSQYRMCLAPSLSNPPSITDEIIFDDAEYAFQYMCRTFLYAIFYLNASPEYILQVPVESMPRLAQDSFCTDVLKMSEFLRSDVFDPYRKKK